MSSIKLFRIIIILLVASLQVKAAELPVEAFGSLPVSRVALSPDGNKIAYKGVTDGHIFIASVNLKTKKKNYLIHTDNKKFKLGWFRWANDDIILVSAHYPNQLGAMKFGENRLLKVPADGTGSATPVFKPRNNERMPQYQANVIDFLPNDPDHILMALNLDHWQYPDVYKINIASKRGKRKLIKRWQPNNEAWKVDRQSRIRLGFGIKEGRGFYRLLDLKSKKWRRIWEYEILGDAPVSPLGFAADPNQLYVRANHNGRFAIFKVDVSKENLPMELIFSDPEYDVEGKLIYSTLTNDVIGVFHGEADGAKVFFDDKYKAFQRGLDQAIPNAYNQVVDFSRDEKKYVLFSSNPEEPGAFYYGDRESKSLSFLLDQYPLLYQQHLSGKEKVVYQARDKVDIEAYLTMPHRGIKENNPAIIIPHGGPMARIYEGFDWFTEFFASRGYVILQPNFRGSSGYGFEFALQSIGDWGGVMQDDLGDAANWLATNYSVDKKSICILGGSYGGYAAMMGAVKQQDIFKCAASFSGISDLDLLLTKARKFTNYDIVKKQIGSDATYRKNRSPVNHAENIDIPMMLIHGESDLIVHVDQSRRMFKALQKHNKPVEYIELENGNHFMSIEENRIKVLTSFERFLNEHIPVPKS
jgi:dipeptidyl aminopeptidase/acylaminoacyl peptidase